MKALAVLALSLPFGGHQPSPAAEAWSSMSVMGLDLLVGPADTKIGFSGVTATMPVRAAGGEGTATVRQGLSRDISVALKDADARQLAALFDLPPWLGSKLVGRVGVVRLDTQGEKFELRASGFRIPGDPISRVEATGDTKSRTVTIRAYALGGMLEYSGRMPSGD